MTQKNFYVAPRGDKWIAKAEGGHRATRVVDTQREAIPIARQRAIKEHSELTIRGKNGQIREKKQLWKRPIPTQRVVLSLGAMMSLLFYAPF